MLLHYTEGDIIKTIPNYKNYEISTYGEVYNIKTGKYIKPLIERGYKTVRLVNESGRHHVAIHRLVALVYVPNPENKYMVHHKDGNPLNNHYSNLEWGGSPKSKKHAKSILQKAHAVSRKSVIIDGVEYPSLSEAGRSLGINKGTVYQRLNSPRYPDYRYKIQES